MKHLARRHLWAALCMSGAMAARAQSTPTPASTRPTAQDSVTVTADRGLAGINDSATSTTTLSAEQMQQQPGLSLDDALHQVAGFTLYRRTGSWTANPTTEGVSLRGLGSTAASRTLVVSDEVPLNDPFGGWIHWDEIPALAIDRVQLERGGASDLYGSSAIGGVVNVVPVEPGTRHGESLLFSADAAGASENSANQDALLSTTSKRVAFLGAESFLTTGGYIPTAPSLRGLVDIPSNVTSEAGRVGLRGFALQQKASAFLRGNVLNEARSNGTPLQTNGTRLWRYTAGADYAAGKSTALLRLYGAREAYRQSFSSIATDRNSETLTKLQRVPLDQAGLVAQAARAMPHQLTAAVGFDIDDVRATDNEAAVSKIFATATTSISARQRETGGFVDAIWTPRTWSLSGSVRVDSFHTYDARQAVSTSSTIVPLPDVSELVASPRLGLVFQPQSHAWPRGLALTATAFRAFRGPTMNELYRTGQVGQQTTLANPSLHAERATGAEGGIELDRRIGHLRATYFWTEANRPISAVLLSQTATTQTLQRQNLGQIRSRGIMLEAQSARWRGLDASFGYQLAVATVTAFNTSSTVQANLKGNWIPEVPREMATATANYSAPHVASFHAIVSYTGQAFDDSSNQYLLHPYARFDVSADRSLTHGFSLFAGAQNLLNRSIDAGRTPILTLAAPRLVQGGIRYTFKR
ncbi:Outer membrane receptor proteins, mostly Fe transport [Bryocella elongata]|uniref:Outer membrane receptor proteins, mostly Fe transport n=1 Tax=Bryocella elongata TaxID=863522 RepID=A0A1H5WC44_9BACT|nr:TonB-dependent receptor [Bryocella elongata]SEF97042.1 Outer membrane receptor proteins, mostly Fe transport [Bryocella elongata]